MELWLLSWKAQGRFAKVYRRDSGLRLGAFCCCRADLHRHLLDDADSKALERGNAPRVVGQQADAGDIQVRKYLSSDTDLSLGATLMIGQCRLAAFVMKENGFLVTNVLNGESLGALVKVDHRATAFFGDHLQGAINGRVTFTGVRAKDIANQTMRVHAHQHGIFGGEAGGKLAHYESNVRLAIDFALV